MLDDCDIKNIWEYTVEKTAKQIYVNVLRASSSLSYNNKYFFQGGILMTIIILFTELPMYPLLFKYDITKYIVQNNYVYMLW